MNVQSGHEQFDSLCNYKEYQGCYFRLGFFFADDYAVLWVYRLECS